MTTRALLVNGTVGSGKTTTIEHCGDLLREAGVAHALLDLDWLRNAWPAPADDVFNVELELAGLAAMAGVVRAAGHDTLLLAGVLEDPGLLDRYREAAGGPLTVVRLVVDLDWVRARLDVRHGEDPDALRWHRQRAGELHDVLERTGSAERVVRVAAGETPRQVAVRVLQAAGWMEA